MDTSSPLGVVGRIRGVRYPIAGGGDRRPPAAGDLGPHEGRTDGITVQAGQGLRPRPQGTQLAEEVKEQASKPENRRKLKEFGQRFMKRR